MNVRNATKAYALAIVTYHYVEKAWRIKFTSPIAEKVPTVRWEERSNRRDAVACAMGDAVGVRFAY